MADENIVREPNTIGQPQVGEISQVELEGGAFFGDQDSTTGVFSAVTKGDQGPKGDPGDGGEDNVQSNWEETDSTNDSYILNKLNIANFDSTKDYALVGQNVFYNNRIFVSNSTDLGFSVADWITFPDYTEGSDVSYENGIYTSKIQSNTTEPTKGQSTPEWDYRGSLVPETGGTVGFWKEYATTDQIPGASGGGSAITIQDAGVDLATAATTLNFVGANITATGDGAVKTITVTTPTGTGPDTATLYAILLSGGFTQLSKGVLASRQQYTGALAGVSSLTYYWDSTTKGWFAADTGGVALIAFP